MRKFALIIWLFTTQLVAQSPAEDKVRFNSAVDWLNNKLDYLYYDNNNGNWWNNTFYMNEDRVVTIKQISSKTPQTANIKNKNYTIRKFKIEDINPYTIQIKEVDESIGRFVKGQLLEIHTFSDKKNIHKTINNRRATSTSFLHLSFPTALTDTLVNYPELVKEKFYEAVISTTMVYASNASSNKEMIMSIMEGAFQKEDGSEMISEAVFENTLKLETENAFSFFGYDESKQQFYFNTVSNEGVNTDYFQIKEDIHLILESVEDPDKTILFETKNSFQLNGTWYFRK